MTEQNVYIMTSLWQVSCIVICYERNIHLGPMTIMSTRARRKCYICGIVWTIGRIKYVDVSICNLDAAMRLLFNQIVTIIVKLFSL